MVVVLMVVFMTPAIMSERLAARHHPARAVHVPTLPLRLPQSALFHPVSLNKKQEMDMRWAHGFIAM